MLDLLDTLVNSNLSLELRIDQCKKPVEVRMISVSAYLEHLDGYRQRILHAGYDCFVARLKEDALQKPTLSRSALQLARTILEIIYRSKTFKTSV